MSMPNRTDDPSIGNDEPLWRRLLPSWVELTPSGELRVCSVAFKDRRSYEVSVHIAVLTSQERVLQNYAGQGIASLVASIPRSLQYAIVREPEPGDDSHALICPPPERPKKQRMRDAKEMAKRSTIVVPPVAE